MLPAHATGGPTAVLATRAPLPTNGWSTPDVDINGRALQSRSRRLNPPRPRAPVLRGCLAPGPEPAEGTRIEGEDDDVGGRGLELIAQLGNQRVDFSTACPRTQGIPATSFVAGGGQAL